MRSGERFRAACRGGRRASTDMCVVRLYELTQDFRVGFWRPRPFRMVDRVTLDVQPGEVLG